jgi:Bacteriophage probable baseplate hub protein
MKLEELSGQYHDFYAPSFVVRLSGDDLMRKHLVAVSQVEVDLKLGMASHFSFTLTDCYSHKAHKFLTGDGDDLLEMLTFGAKVEINMGYRDGQSMPLMLSGLVTEITTNFPEGDSPEISVSGMDNGFLLTLGKNSKNWSKQKDSAVASEIAAFHNLDAIIEPTLEERPQIEQNQMSDWDFLKTLADRNTNDRKARYELFVDERNRIHFAGRNNNASDVVELVYGQGLLSFKPEANLANQVSRVEVYGWDRNNAKRIIGVAKAGEESGRSGKSASQTLETLVVDPKKRPTLRLRQPVFTQSEADQRAKAALDEHASKFLTGEGETIGLPLLRPDSNVKLSQLADRFSKTYYINETTHKVDSNGYRTRFKVEETRL